MQSNSSTFFGPRRRGSAGVWPIVAALFAALLFASAAHAARRALVIGIDKYKSVSELRKAVNDADAVAKVLGEAGFKVTVKHDSDRRDLFDGLLGFVESIQGGDEVVFFFAGHGVQIDSASFLLPADFRATSDKQVSVDALSLQ